MNDTSRPGDGSQDNRAWYITARWQQFHAERHANFLRSAALGVFYVVHLASYGSSQQWLPSWGVLQLAQPGEVGRQFHIAVTLLAVAWAMMALVVYLCLEQRIFPRWMPFATTACDVVLLTTVICLAAGPRSPLVAAYFLLLTLAALRLSPVLLRFATAASCAGYLCVLGCAKWFTLHPPPPSPGEGLGEGAPDTENLISNLALQTVPRYHQLIVLLALILAGLILEQLVRQARRVAEDYRIRIEMVGDDG